MSRKCVEMHSDDKPVDKVQDMSSGRCARCLQGGSSRFKQQPLVGSFCASRFRPFVTISTSRMLNCALTCCSPSPRRAGGWIFVLSNRIEGPVAGTCCTSLRQSRAQHLGIPSSRASILGQAMRTDNLLERMSRPRGPGSDGCVRSRQFAAAFALRARLAKAKSLPLRQVRACGTLFHSGLVQVGDHARRCFLPGQAALPQESHFAVPIVPKQLAKAGRQTKAEEREGHFVPSKQHEGRVALRTPWSSL